MARQVDNISYGFKVGVKEPIDTRFVLSKTEMRAISDNPNHNTAGILMPEKYFALCSDDGKMYEYDESRTEIVSTDVGKFRPFESVTEAYKQYLDVNGQPQSESILEDKIITVNLKPYQEISKLYYNSEGRAVALTGSYDDLNDKPAINDGEVTFAPTDTLGQGTKIKDILFDTSGSPRLVLHFSANQKDDTPWNLPTATYTSNLVNDGNGATPLDPFETKAEVQADLIPYSKIVDTGYVLKKVEDSSTPREYKFHIELWDKDETQMLSETDEIDIPLETAVNDVVLSDDYKKLLVYKIDGSHTEIDIQLVIDAYDLANKAYVNSEGARVEALVNVEKARAIAREAELEAEKEQVIVQVAPITKTVDATDPKKIDIGLDIDSKTLSVNSNNKLTVNSLTYGDALEKVDGGTSPDTINVLVDDKTVKVNSNNKLELPLDNDTIYVDSTDNKIKGKQQYGVIHGEYNDPTYGILGAATLIDNPNPGIYGNYDKLIGVNIDNSTITLNGGKLVAAAAKLTDVRLNGKTVVDNDPTSATYTKALIKIGDGLNTWVRWNNSEGSLVIDGQEFILGDGLAWASGSGPNERKPMLYATGVVTSYNNLEDKPHLKAGTHDLELEGTIDVINDLGVKAETEYKATSSWFTSGMAVKSAIDQFKNSLDSTATANTGYALAAVKMNDGQLSMLDEILIPTVHDGKLTLKKNGVVLGSFTADQETDTAINLEIPTKTSDIDNDGPPNGTAPTADSSYSILSETGYKHTLTYEASTFSIVSTLYNKNNTALSTVTTLLPFENVFVEAKYVEQTSPEVKRLVFKNLAGAEKYVDLTQLVDEYEKLKNKTTSDGAITESSDDDHYASTKLLYNTFKTKQDKLPTYIAEKFLRVKANGTELEWVNAQSYVIVDTTTTLAQINEYYNNGKIVLAEIDSLWYTIKACTSAKASFEAITGSGLDEITDKVYAVTSAGWAVESTKKAMNYVDYAKSASTDLDKVLSVQETSTAGTYAPAWVYPALHSTTVSLTTADWTAYGTDAFTKTVVVTGVRADRAPIIGLYVGKDSATASETMKSEWSKIYCIETLDNNIVVYATSVPTMNLTLQISGY